MYFEIEPENIIKQKQVSSVWVVLYRKASKKYTVLIIRGKDVRTVGTWGAKKYAITKYSTIIEAAQITHDVMEKKPEVILRKAEDKPALKLVEG